MSRKVVISTVQLLTPNYSEDVSVKEIRNENLKSACGWIDVTSKEEM